MFSISECQAFGGGPLSDPHIFFAATVPVIPLKEIDAGSRHGWQVGRLITSKARTEFAHSQ